MILHPARHTVVLLLVASVFALCSTSSFADQRAFSQWPATWPGQDGSFFPICVWTQNPSRAGTYKSLGVNTYMGLWDGPTSTQLSQLKANGMYAICSQNTTGLTNANNDIIIGWLLPDEPDNAQSNPAGGYYSPREPYPGTPWNTCPHTPVSTLAASMRANDTTRPIVLNLGQGVAWDGWVGRGIRSNHPEDYPDYIASTDIVSFDIYPGNSTRTETSGKYELVAYGVDRLIGWSDPQNQAVFNCVEVSNIRGSWRPQPDKIRMEMWSSIVHGSLGLVFFCHEFEPFVEAGVLQYTDVCEMLTFENGLIQSLAQVINSPNSDVTPSVSLTSSYAKVDIMTKSFGNYLYIFAVNMTGYTTMATFAVPGITQPQAVESVRDGSTIMTNPFGQFSPFIDGYEVQIYRIAMGSDPGDANGDGSVNLDDFIILKQNYGKTTGASWDEGDFNDDGAVNLDDFIILKQNYGS